MIEISLTRGKTTIIDEKDLELISQYKWCAVEQGKKIKCWYAKTNIGGGTALYLHRLLMNPPVGLEVDHINRNGLDNRRSNLRIATRSQNNANRKSKNVTSNYQGVCWSRRDKKWRANIQINRKKQSLGYFDSEIEAAKAYDKKAKELFGEFAILNF